MIVRYRWGLIGLHLPLVADPLEMCDPKSPYEIHVSWFGPVKETTPRSRESRSLNLFFFSSTVLTGVEIQNRRQKNEKKREDKK